MYLLRDVETIYQNFLTGYLKLILIIYKSTKYTYINGSYNPSVRIIDLVSHTNYVVCVTFIHKWRDLQFKVDSELQVFWETFHGNIIYSQTICQKSVERKLSQVLINFYFYFTYIINDLLLCFWCTPMLCYDE